MVLLSYLAFFDSPKATTADAIRACKEHGVTTKILMSERCVQRKAKKAAPARGGSDYTSLCGTECFLAFRFWFWFSRVSGV